jgi:hypothetical protein
MLQEEVFGTLTSPLPTALRILSVTSASSSAATTAIILSVPDTAAQWLLTSCPADGLQPIHQTSRRPQQKGEQM